MSAAAVIDSLRLYMSRILAPRATLHGVFLDILGMGVLLTGDSGLGKSELGLELISRGHGLVADDAVDFVRLGPDFVEGRCPPLLQNLLEVRGLGIVRLPHVASARLALAVELAAPAARLPAPRWFDALDLPMTLIDPQAASAPERVALALDCALGRVTQVAGAFTA